MYSIHLQSLWDGGRSDLESRAYRVESDFKFFFIFFINVIGIVISLSHANFYLLLPNPLPNEKIRWCIWSQNINVELHKWQMVCFWFFYEESLFYINGFFTNLKCEYILFFPSEYTIHNSLTILLTNFMPVSFLV